MYEIIASILGLFFAVGLVYKLSRAEKGTEKMVGISALIQNGAKTFLNKEYMCLGVIVFVVALALMFLDIRTSLAFVFGAFFSALTGNIGMRIATSSNTKTAYAAEKSLGKGLKVAFSAGSVMGFFVVGLGLLGISVLYLIFKEPSIIYGFGFGASLVALFARVSGGIYTKAADVAADIVGKVEKKIPEDDPRNPAVIADQVGDNVGDIAGMGADLFESYVDAIIATMVIGTTLAAFGVIVPMLIAGIGIISSIISYFFVKVNEEKIHGTLNKGIYASTILTALGSFLVLNYLGVGSGVLYSILTGLMAGLVIGESTEYYTSVDRKPAINIAKESKTGPATNVIAGLATGMESTLIPVLSISAAILISFNFSGIYGIGMAAVGMLSTLGTTLATDCFGPVVDNAEGIAKMSGRSKKARKRCEALDATGNTTAAVGKGFAIGSAALTSLVLFSAYASATGLSVISLVSPKVVAALFIGALLPFLFSSLTMRSVGRTASKIIEEIRRQFKNKNIMKGKKRPDYKKCIEISTNAALKEMILPGLIAVATPLAVGFLMGPEALGGLLAGNIATGFLLAVTLSNAGGAWDNAKKYVEKGNFGGEGSKVYAATVIGDTVGDPCKDTAGPSLNILIKLVAIVSIVFLPLFI